MTAGLLPPELRAPFGFRWSARQQSRFDRALARTFAVYRVLPTAVRTAPSRFFLARVRAESDRGLRSRP